MRRLLRGTGEAVLRASVGTRVRPVFVRSAEGGERWRVRLRVVADTLFLLPLKIKGRLLWCGRCLGGKKWIGEGHAGRSAFFAER